MTHRKLYDVMAIRQFPGTGKTRTTHICRLSCPNKKKGVEYVKSEFPDFDNPAIEIAFWEIGFDRGGRVDGIHYL